MASYVCSLQGLSLMPVILYSWFEGLTLILRFLSVLLAYLKHQVKTFWAKKKKNKEPAKKMT